MNVVIMAQGQASRFPGKHFAKVNGEAIIARTVRLSREILPDSTITIVAHDTAEFRELGCDIHTQADPGDGLMTGLYNTQSLWAREDTIILLGDVVFSRQALATVLHTERHLAFFGRTGKNRFTGCPYGEIFAMVVHTTKAKMVQEAIAARAARMFSEGRLWGLKHHLSDHGEWVEINDWTDDVDTKEDLAAVRLVMDTMICCITTCKGRLEHLKISMPMLAEEFVDDRRVVVDYDCPNQSGQWVLHEGLGHVEFVENAPHFHKTRALNLGARAAQDARWLCFIDADVLVHPGTRSALLELSENDDRAIVVAHHADPTLVGFLFVSRKAFDAVGGYDECFDGWGFQDTDLRLRLMADAGCEPRALGPSLLSALRHTDELRSRYQREPFRLAIEKHRKIYLQHLADREHKRTPAWVEFIDRWRGDDIGK